MGESLKENKVSSVAMGRNLMKQGQIPPSWLMCHLAGECYAMANSSPGEKQGLDSETLLQLWDRILTSGNCNATRFFLTLAVLEQAADKLILLIGDELDEGLQSVWTLHERYFPAELHWKEYEWWSSAQALLHHTPQSVLQRIQKSEDDAVLEALKQRSLKAEAEVKERLESAAAAHKLAQETTVKQARDRLSRARLVAIYRQHAPDKESNIGKILEAYNGRLQVLDQKLKQKYGVGFNPALDPKKPDDASQDQPKKLGPNKFLATMNQSLSAVGRQKVATLNDATDEDEGYSIPKAKDQVSVTVAPSEVLPILCWSKEAAAARGTKLTIAATTRYWDNLKFYLMDSRTEQAASEQGRFPTSLELTPEFLMDPESLRENEDRFESLRGMCHIVVMGEGYSALPKLYNQKLSPKLEPLMKEDESRTNGCALFFCKKGFPCVSVLEDNNNLSFYYNITFWMQQYRIV